MNIEKWRTGSKKYFIRSSGVPIIITKKKDRREDEYEFRVNELGDHYGVSVEYIKSWKGRFVTKPRFDKIKKDYEQVNISH